MSFTTWNTPPNNGAAGATNIQVWGSALSSALATVGLVKGTDTGQINWSTVVTPSTTSTVAGFEIWKFSDALQATAPVFLKIEYGTNASVVSVPGIWMTIGTGTDGAGNITGLIRARTLISSTNSTTTSLSNFLTSDGSSVYFAGWQTGNSSGYPVSFLIERSRDSSGTPTNKGLCTTWAIGGNAPNWIVYNYATPTLFCNWSTSSPATTPVVISGTSFSLTSSTATDASTAPAIPIVVYAPGVPAWTLQCAILVSPGDQANAMTITVNGSPHTYRGIVSFIGYGLISGAAAVPYIDPAMLVS